jgi:hypothetical protein
LTIRGKIGCCGQRGGAMTSLSTPIVWRLYDVQAVLPAALLPVCVCVLGPWWSQYQFNIDEGVNLIKGALVANGYHLYDQIWDDQPPVLTLILAAVHLVFPFNVAVPRAIILAVASALLWSLFRLVRRSDGVLAAWIAVAALGTSNLFLVFSVSVLIGLPAIALAVCAIDQAMVGALEKKPQRYLLSGLLFGLSLQIKMFTVLMLPSLICAVLCVPKASMRTDRRRARDVTLTLGVALATFLTIAIVMREPLLPQLFMPHLISGRAAEFYSKYHGWAYLGGLLAREPILLVLGAAGVVATLLRPHDLYGARSIPFLWLCISLITFANHRPVFLHHLPMILVPLAWLGGSAVQMGVSWLATIGAGRSQQNSLVFAVVAILITAGALHAPNFYFNDIVTEDPVALATAEFRKYSTAEPWVVTDLPMAAYRAGVLVPPELAVFSAKRWINGYLPTPLIISVIRERRPSQVMFHFFSVDSELEHFLNNSFYVRWSAEPHYIRSDLARTRPGTIAPPQAARPN